MTPEKILEIARNEIGYRETPSNLTKYGKWYGLDGNPWCMMFVMWCFDQAGALPLLPKRTASCTDLMSAAKKANCWITSGFRPGDVVLYNFDRNPANSEHVGIVESVNATSIIAIEGNTSSTSNANGGQVMRRNRPLSLVLGAVRPRWETAAKLASGTFKIGGTVRFVGNRQYATSYNTAASYPARACTATITAFREGGTHPYHLNGDGIEGWADAADVLDMGYQVRVKVNSILNIRTGPGTEYDRDGYLENEDIVTIMAERDGWGQMKDGNWIKLEYTERI